MKFLSSCSRFAARGAFTMVAVTLFVAGCSAAATKDDMTSSSDALRPIADDEIVGSVSPGQTLGPIRHEGTPEYRALRLAATAGASYEIWVRSNDGDALGFVLDGRGKSVARNDDGAEGTTDARLAFVAKESGAYTIVFRERDFEPATFTVRVQASGGAAVDGGGAIDAGDAGAAQGSDLSSADRACLACAAERCAAEQLTCASSGCVDYAACNQQCTSLSADQSPPCFEACEVAFPAAVKASYAFGGCLQQQCKATCFAP